MILHYLQGKTTFAMIGNVLVARQGNFQGVRWFTPTGLTSDDDDDDDDDEGCF